MRDFYCCDQRMAFVNPSGGAWWYPGSMYCDKCGVHLGLTEADVKKINDKTKDLRFGGESYIFGEDILLNRLNKYKKGECVAIKLIIDNRLSFF